MDNKSLLKRKRKFMGRREKQMNLNHKLRKILLPKNAVAALNEIKGITMTDFTYETSINGGFTASVAVNGKLYEGSGITKVAAKHSVCKNALRNYVVLKMNENPRNAPQLNAGEDMNLADGEISDSDSNDSPAEISDDDEDVPMISLASYALHKLYGDWEKDHIIIPDQM